MIDLVQLLCPDDRIASQLFLQKTLFCLGDAASDNNLLALSINALAGVNLLSQANPVLLTGVVEELHAPGGGFVRLSRCAAPKNR